MIVARHISGIIGKWRSRVRALLLIFYLILPWMKWNNRPFVLLDIGARKFYFPGIVLWPQEFYFFLLIGILLGLSLFFFTSLFGRIWCGWGCPQTIYTELFDTVGRLLNPGKFGKRSEKLIHKIPVHFVWFILSAVLTFHFIAYFVGSYRMISDFQNFGTGVFAEYTWPYIWLFSSVLFYFDLGIFREQFCVYICPYARFQSVMLDRDSIVIAYDRHRGEPRRSSSNLKAGATGDCTACNMCVLVCPTGIDIREGTQVSCINCGHCVDACNQEMGKHGKESLVGFSSQNYFENRQKTRFVRPRTIVYSILLILISSILTVLFILRNPVDLSVQRDRNIQPLLTEGIVQNYYEVKIANLKEKDAVFMLDSEIDDPLKRKAFLMFEQLTGENPFTVHSSEIKTLRLVLRGEIKNLESISHIVQIRVSVKEIGSPENKTSKLIPFTIPIGKL